MNSLLPGGVVKKALERFSAFRGDGAVKGVDGFPAAVFVGRLQRNGKCDAGKEEECGGKMVAAEFHGWDTFPFRPAVFAGTRLN